jgi:hypothetical protein
MAILTDVLKMGKAERQKPRDLDAPFIPISQKRGLLAEGNQLGESRPSSEDCLLRQISIELENAR